ncbi:MAG: cysteine desulfurase family protein [Caldisericia bacterium]|jgi:cysteine desulfurase|nr:cysteine desulfurase family protein [Caldisericia bacterium]
MKRIYLDNATTTRVDDEVLKEINYYYTEIYGVPSSIFSHREGLLAKEKVESTRELISKKINKKEGEIIFTSGGTEGNNIIIKGVSNKLKEKGNHLITSPIEHLSVLNVMKFLEKKGFQISYVRVDKNGFVDLDELKKLIKKDTILISIQHVNQETGVIQNIEEIGKIAKEKEVLFHVDSSLGFPFLDVDVEKMNIDFLTITAHKFHGPKGVGAIYIRDLNKLKPIMHGGYNEFNLRPGTENVPLIAGLGKAIEIFNKEDYKRINELRLYLLEKIKNEISDIRINTPIEKSHSGILNITFYFVEGESIVLRMDMVGVSLITGSACYSKSLEASHVLLAMGLSHEDAHGSIRFSLSKYNTKEEIDYVVEELKKTIKFLRDLSPLKREN